MKNMNMKWISFVAVLVMMFTLLAPMALAEGLAPDALEPDAVLSETLTDGSAEDAVAEDGVTKDDVTEYDAPKMIFEPMNFVDNLYYMGLGMLGIFVVIGVIILATAALNKAFQDKKKD